MNLCHFIHEVSCCSVSGDSSNCVQIEKEGNRSISVTSMLYHIMFFYMQKTPPAAESSLEMPLAF